MGKAFIGNKDLYEQSDEVQKKRPLKEIIKVVTAITVAFISIILTCFICFVIYKNGLSAESVLSVLLAFFSIFISIFFYFKADETSNKFYDSSYCFMKEQSNLLGRIEERFGEKFENLTSKIEHLDVMKVTTEKEIESKEKEIETTLNEAIENLSEENKIAKEKLEKKRNEYQKLINEINNIRNESNIYFNYMKPKYLNNMYSDERKAELIRFFNLISAKEMNYLLRCNKIQETDKLYEMARRYHICNKNGEIYPDVRKFICDLNDIE